MKTPSLVRCLLSSALLLAPGAAFAQAAPSPAPAQAADPGKSHFTNGVALYREGDFRGALIEFRRAYELTHNYRALYNIGQASFELQDYAEALRSFQKYLADGGAEIEADRRAQVEGDLKKLSARVARLAIKTNVPGASVLVDDVVVGHAPLAEPLVVSAGRRKITVQAPAMPPTTRMMDVAGGDAKTITIDVAQAFAAAEAPTPAPSGPSRTGLWISLGFTGALTAGAVTMGVLALNAHADGEKKLATRGVAASDIESAGSKTRAFAATSDVLTATAGAMAIVSIVLAATSGTKRPDAPKPSVGLLVAPRALGIEGRF
jgi:tetratricopeptide (TPR) repeat protein